MIIPIAELTEELLDNIVQDFVLREGTEYGMEDIALEDKVTQVKQQLHSGIAVLVYSELHETVNIMPKEQFNQQHSTEQSE